MEEPFHPSLEAERPKTNSIHPLDPADIPDHGLCSEVEPLRESYQNLQSKCAAAEENLALLQQQMDECVNHNARLSEEIAQITGERDSLRDKVRYFETILKQKVDEFSKLNEGLGRKEGLKKEVGDFQDGVQKLESEREERNGSILKTLDSLSSTKDCLSRVIEGLEEEKNENGVKGSEEIFVDSELSEESRVLLEEVRLVSRLAIEVESRADKYKQLRKKEKRELENSLISLTEENRDINNLLRIALLEKEAVEKRLKGNDHKRVALLQIAERGLQKVGFGFMMGSGTNEQPTDSSGATMEAKSDSSECEEEVVCLASTVERIMKNLRLEITQLRRSLEESRLDTERLQCFTEKQAKEIVENKFYIKELEDRESILTQNVEELLMEIKETEEEVARWKEACELEVEAGENVIEECDKLVAALKQELQKTKAALDISNGKLRLKEELASAAIAAQAAAERSLQLADSRAVELRQRIEELNRQLEEAEKREQNSHRVRHICWPWPVFKMSSGSIANTRVGNGKRMLPEMQALLH